MREHSTGSGTQLPDTLPRRRGRASNDESPGRVARAELARQAPVRFQNSDHPLRHRRSLRILLDRLAVPLAAGQGQRRSQRGAVHASRVRAFLSRAAGRSASEAHRLDGGGMGHHQPPGHDLRPAARGGDDDHPPAAPPPPGREARRRAAGHAHRHTARGVRQLRRAHRPGDDQGRRSGGDGAGHAGQLAHLQRDRPGDRLHPVPLVPRGAENPRRGLHRPGGRALARATRRATRLVPRAAGRVTTARAVPVPEARGPPRHAAARGRGGEATAARPRARAGMGGAPSSATSGG